MTTKITFDESLEDDDWGLIISANGQLKGLFIPDGKDEDEVPDTIVEMCIQFFGIDVTEEETIH